MAVGEGAAWLNDASLRRRLGPERFSAEQQAEIKAEIALAVSDISEGGFKTEFDAFGARRQALDFASFSDGDIQGFDTTLATRGFTGHEGMDAVGLVHMNGRG